MAKATGTTSLARAVGAVGGSTDGPHPCKGSFAVGDKIAVKTDVLGVPKGRQGVVGRINDATFDNWPIKVILDGELAHFPFSAREIELVAEPWDGWTAIDSLKGDEVDNPPHYTGHPSGIECWDFAQYFPYLIGCAFKYLWRTDAKGDPITNLRKAVAVINKEIERRTTDE